MKLSSLFRKLASDLLLIDVYRFEPQPDITAYELALILKYTSRPGGLPMEEVAVARGLTFGLNLSRHFVFVRHDEA